MERAELDYRDHKIILSPDLQFPKPEEAEQAGSEQSFIGDGCGTALSSKIAGLLIGKKNKSFVMTPTSLTCKRKCKQMGISETVSDETSLEKYQ